MSRTIFIVAGVFSVPSLLLVDSAVKGTALLMLAAVAAIILRRDSAATRHLVWLLAIVAMLAVPVLSAMLPQWRVLPEWASIPPATAVVATSPPSVTRPAIGAVEVAQNAEPDEVESPFASAYQPAAALRDSRPALVAPEIIPESAVWSWNWLYALPLAWAIGFYVLVLRLMAARWMLWNAERHGTVIWSSRQPAKATDDPIVTALEAVCIQLGMCRPVTVLIHPDKTIPVVWGNLRHCLLLPVAARRWTGEQLRSVLLHELAHIKRRDTMAQLLTQVACALHWFNPLVWVAAWRLRVERERACDDLVLASGVQPSAYAGHLLEVATALSPARWTQSCGLAMARQSSLEGRLVAVLSEHLNRRGVSVALAVIGLAIAACVAVPIAMLRAADVKPGAPVRQQEPQKPKEGAKLQPGTEEKLQWGEPVNGLRAAIVIRPASDKPKAGDMPDLYLVIQNVSNAPIRLKDTTAAPKRRELYIKLDGKTQAGFVGKEPTDVDAILQPREVAFLRLFSPDPKNPNGRNTGAIIAEGALKDTRQTMVAKLNVEGAPAGAWTGKLVTGETSGAAAAGQPLPNDKTAQALFKKWQDNARMSGTIPGGALGSLADAMANFVKLNPTDERAPKLSELLKRIDMSHDWTQADAVVLLDDVTAIYANLPEWAESEWQSLSSGRPIQPIQSGQPLPAALENAPWGEAQPNGLRAAWLLEPRAQQHRLGTPLKSRILFHNAGKNAVMFRALTWNQSGEHKARDAKGTEIHIVSTSWTILPRVVAFRLAPGEYTEVTAAGIGVGANKDNEDWQGTRVGSWVGAKEGDNVTFIPAPVSVNGKDGTGPSNLDESRWWLDFITDRLRRDMPLPADAPERGRILDRAMRELFGTAPTPEEIATFVSDRAPDALGALANRLAQRAGISPFTGSLTSGPTKFKVLPADPDAAKKPRSASNPGRYTLGENIRLVVSRRPIGERIVNEANIQFFSPDRTKPAPSEPREIRLPDGYNTWAAAWVRGETVLWVQEKSGVRSYNFSNSTQVKEEAVEPEKVPAEIREALHGALTVAEPKPARKGGPSAPSPPASVRP